MKPALFLVLAIGCGGASTTPVKSRPAPTETDACERLCTIFEDCRISPPNCSATCAADQQKLRDGIQPSLVACLERELDHCEFREMTERRQIVSICFSAVVEAYAKDDSAIGKIVHAVCTREANCATEHDAECEKKLGEKLKSSPQSKTLAIGRPEVVAKLADCIEKSGCSEADPITACTQGGP